MRFAPFLLALSSVSFVASAALPPLPANTLRAGADTIVVGVIESVSTADDPIVNGSANRHYELQIRAEVVEKGGQVDRITAKGWNVLVRRNGWVGPGGVRGLSGLKAGQHVRVYLRGSRILEPNGLESMLLVPDR